MSNGITSFIFQGQQPVPLPTGSDTSSAFPSWLQSSIYGEIGAANQLAGQSFTPFPGPQVYSPSQNTSSAWNLASNNVGNWQPALGQAGALTQAAAQPISTDQALGYASPFSTSVPQLGGTLSGALNQNAQAGASGYYGSMIPNVAGGGAALTGAANASTMGSLPSYLGAYGSGVAGTGAGLTGALNQATQGGISGYMSPYTQQVVNATEGALNQNFQNNILPQISSQFTAGGQAGSPQQAEADARAGYYQQQAVGQAIAPELQQGYFSALQAAQQAAGTGFGSAQAGYGGALNAATGATNLGLGTAAQGYGGALSAGLNTANTGLGTATGAYNTGLGTALTEQQMQQTAGAQEGQLGALTSQLGAVDAHQLAAAGQAQDTLSQANINAALNNFYQQQQWPYQNLSFLSDITRGLPYNTSSQTAGTTYGAAYGASPLSTGLGVAAAGSVLGLKRGGRVPRRAAAQGRRGALNQMRRAA